MKCWSICVSFIACLIGCTGAQPRIDVPHCPSTNDGSNQWQCFSRPEKATQGMARLYVFRPDLSKLQTSDQPVLIIDDSYQMTVSRWSYSFIDLPIGRHIFHLTPRASDSPIWNLEGAFEISEEGPFYLAIWNSDISLKYSPNYSGYAKNVAKSTTIGVITTALSGGFAIFPVQKPPPAIVKGGVSEARFELVSEDDALVFLRQCELSSAKQVGKRDQ